MPDTPTAIIALLRLGPSTAMMTSASRMPGNASMTSTTREMVMSTPPR